LLISQFCHAKEPENWKLVKHDRKKGIEIYLRVLSDGNIEFKGITYIKTSLNSIVALFEDTDSLHKWLYKTKKVTILKRLNDKENYVYSIHNMPFLFSNRDSIVHTTVAQDPESYTVTIRGKATPDYLPEKKGFVRVRQVESFWRFEPQENGNVRIVFQGYGDPGGKILTKLYRSAFVSRFFKSFLWKFPFRTIKEMKSIVKEKKYQAEKFSYITEPRTASDQH